MPKKGQVVEIEVDMNHAHEGVTATWDHPTPEKRRVMIFIRETTHPTRKIKWIIDQVYPEGQLLCSRQACQLEAKAVMMRQVCAVGQCEIDDVRGWTSLNDAWRA